MEPTGPPRMREIALPAGWCLVNLALLTLIALATADQYEDEAINSATPVADGALIALAVVAVLVLANGGLLSLKPRTRRLGVGILLGTLLAAPVGFLIIMGFLASTLN